MSNMNKHKKNDSIYTDEDSMCRSFTGAHPKKTFLMGTSNK